ncbi:hypothetical protein RND81_03G069500, partial [Saponaria officinalis]
KLTVTELVESLLAHDKKFKNQESSSEDAFQSMHKSKWSDSKRWKNKSDEDCRQKQTKSKVQAHYSSSVNNEHIFYAGQATTSTNESRWLIDSSCTNHLTNNSCMFCKLDTSVQTPVRLGNGEFVASKGKFTIVVPTKRGTKFIKDVLLFPDLAENLLSVAQMIKNGYSLIFENNHCTIYDPGNKEIAKVVMENKSFSLKWNYNEESLNRAHTNDTWLWHRRYGHFNLRALADLH